MGEFACFGVFVAIAAAAAFIMSIVALNKISAIEEKLQRLQRMEFKAPPRPAEPPKVYQSPSPLPIIEPKVVANEEKTPPLVLWPKIQMPESAPETPLVPAEPAIASSSISDKAAEIAEQMKKEVAAQRLSLELFLGTRGLAIAGCIAVLVGVIVGFKYLYEMKLITPQWQMIIVAGGGIVALAIGQFTRRRGYDIVATALAALGFAMLYAADFAAFGYYHLIGTNLAFGLGIVITAAGMLYAVRLNEIIVAFISLLGGFLSPVLLSTGENRPNTLFGYITILIGGAMACAAVRKWRSVSRLSFVGMIILYAGWFNEWYTPAMYGESIPDQLPVAITWLCVFAAIYLVMPVLYELLKREVAHKGDVLLIVTNAFFCYIYLHQILFSHYRPYLALAAICLGAAHLVMMAVVHKRCPHDKALKLALLVLGLFFVTIAIPLYLKMYAVALAWAGEGMVLTLIGLRYRSRIVQLASFAALTLAIFAVAKHFPLHRDEFTFIFNNAFGSWCFVAAAYYIAHLFYRSEKENTLMFPAALLAQIMFVVSLGLFLIAACMEWHDYTIQNLVIPSHTLFTKGLLVILATFMILYLLPRLKPQGMLPYAVSCFVAIITFVATLVSISDFYKGSFTFILNSSFGSVVFVAAAFYIAHLMHRHKKIRLDADESGYFAQILFSMSLIILMAAPTMEWYGHTRYNLIPTIGILYTKWFIKGMVLICSTFVVLFLLPRFRPKGTLSTMLATILAFITAIGTLTVFPEFYAGQFALFANAPFVIGLAPLAASAIAAMLLYRGRASLPFAKPLVYGYGLGIIFFLWMLLTEEIYLYWNYPGHSALVAGIDKGQMWISILWAVYAAAVISVGLWRKLVTLRYIGLCLFTIVILKVFIYDMSTLEKIYRIAGFIVLGLVLIGVSYLYQYLRKTGFFEKSPSTPNGT